MYSCMRTVNAKQTSSMYSVFCEFCMLVSVIMEGIEAPTESEHCILDDSTNSAIHAADEIAPSSRGMVDIRRAGADVGNDLLRMARAQMLGENVRGRLSKSTVSCQSVMTVPVSRE